MDAEREREIRELAARLSTSNRHRKIGLVLDELLGEIDLLRGGDEPRLSPAEAMAMIENCAAHIVEARRGTAGGAAAWREATLAKLNEYGSEKSPSADVSA